MFFHYKVRSTNVSRLPRRSLRHYFPLPSRVLGSLWVSFGTPFIKRPIPARVRSALGMCLPTHSLLNLYWALKAEITNGTSTTAFSSSKVCDQGKIVTFLYCAYH